MRPSDLKRAGLLAVMMSVAQAAPVLAQQDPGDPVAGELVFKQCSQCHAVGPDPKDGMTGPQLNGIVGKKSATVSGFNYSPQLRSARLTWDIPMLNRFLKAPKSFIAGTRMLFNGLSSPKEIADVIAYLSQFDEAGKKKP